MEAARTDEIPAEAQGRRARRPRGRGGGGVRRMLASTTRLMDVHYQIVLLRAKMTVVRVAIYAGMAVGAVGLGLMGVIFLYVGVFRLLTDVAGVPAWGTFLIYAGGHIVTAVALLVGGMRTIRGRKRS